MLKALIRKQLLEIRYVYLGGGRKKGKKKGAVKAPKNSRAIYVIFVIAYIFIMFGVFGLATLLGSTLFPVGMDWMFFTVMNIFAFLLGIFGSVLSTSNALFRSKDNELLLSMPIPSSKIVFVRMIAVYITGMIYECIVIIPSIICYLMWGNVTAAGVIFSFLSIFIMGFMIAAFSCLAGWIVSLIASKMRNMKILRVLIIAILIGGLYYFQFNAQRIFTYIAQNAQEVAGRVHGWGYPLYAAGLGMSGDIIAFLVFTAMTAVLFLVAYWAVSKSFAKIALTKMSEKKTQFKRSDIKTRGIQDALFRREMKRFTASVTYMLNAGIGILLLIVAAVLLIIKMQDVRMLTDQIASGLHNGQYLISIMMVQAVCVITSMICIAACSISMEGKGIWLYKALPVDPYSIFRAKISVHLVLAFVPALLCALAGGIMLQMDFAMFICMAVYIFMYILLTASFELVMDLRKPKLDWTNENQALKTNVNVLGSTFAALLVPLLVAGIYYLVMGFMGPVMYLVIFIAVFAVLIILIHRWLRNSGTEKFISL